MQPCKFVNINPVAFRKEIKLSGLKHRVVDIMQILNIPNLGREVSCYDMLFDLQYRVYKYFMFSLCLICGTTHITISCVSRGNARA